MADDTGSTSKWVSDVPEGASRPSGRGGEPLHGLDGPPCLLGGRYAGRRRRREEARPTRASIASRKDALPGPAPQPQPPVTSVGAVGDVGWVGCCTGFSSRAERPWPFQTKRTLS
jgi:hypothetical protein